MTCRHFQILDLIDALRDCRRAGRIARKQHLHVVYVFQPCSFPSLICIAFHLASLIFIVFLGNGNPLSVPSVDPLGSLRATLEKKHSLDGRQGSALWPSLCPAWIGVSGEGGVATTSETSRSCTTTMEFYQLCRSQSPRKRSPTVEAEEGVRLADVTLEHSRAVSSARPQPG